MQAIVGAPYTLTFDFKQDGEYVRPDEGSATYTLYDNAGAAVGGQTDISITSDMQVNISIAGTYNTITGSKDFEQRTVRIKYKSDGKDFVAEQWYYVTQLLNYRVTPSDVIVTLGIKEGEALFEEVDLVQAYFKVANSAGASTVVAALSSGGIKQIKINEAIKLTAALDLSTVIELKAFKKFGNELSYSRFDKINFDQIRANLQSKLSDALNIVSDSVSISSPQFLVTNPVNPMTGA